MLLVTPGRADAACPGDEATSKADEEAGFEQSIDSAAGAIVSALDTVLFFTVADSTASIDATQVPTSAADLEPLMAAAAKEVDLAEASFTVKVGCDVDAAAADALQTELREKFVPTTPKGTRKLSVSRDSGTSGVTLEVVSGGVPVIAVWLVFGAVFFTLKMGFINIRAFRHAIDVVRGKYDNPDDEGEVTHFQALASALSATVGLGNIGGVAVAVMVGGPGAILWMIVGGLFGMSAKFVECTLGQKYRTVLPNGEVRGGPMYYLERGLAEKGMAPLGKVLAVLFAILCIGGSFGGGNTFQVNQSLDLLIEQVEPLGEMRWVYGVVMVVAVGVVILGGIKRIAATAEKIVPLMCGVYVAACLWILIANMGAVPEAFRKIFSLALTPEAGYGGIIGVLVTGIRRAAFSNEAGVGSAAIAHSAARTEFPVREGVVALLEPFIDTVIVCTMTGLVIVITGAYDAPANFDLISSGKGAALTARAMATEISWFPVVLTVAAVLFAYSTMISWSYYGERAFVYLFGEASKMAYRVLFLIFIFLGSVVTATNILNFGDYMILSMAVPNILGVLLLSGGIRKDLDSYMKKLKAGAFRVYDTKAK
jgi:AGCS family alanine or glycine:cation symporter